MSVRCRLRVEPMKFNGGKDGVNIIIDRIKNTESTSAAIIPLPVGENVDMWSIFYSLWELENKLRDMECMEIQ